jgi:hypothetical protein
MKGPPWKNHHFKYMVHPADILSTGIKSSKKASKRHGLLQASIIKEDDMAYRDARLKKGTRARYRFHPPGEKPGLVNELPICGAAPRKEEPDFWLFPGKETTKKLGREKKSKKSRSPNVYLLLL